MRSRLGFFDDAGNALRRRGTTGGATITESRKSDQQEDEAQRRKRGHPKQGLDVLEVLNESRTCETNPGNKKDGEEEKSRNPGCEAACRR